MSTLQAKLADLLSKAAAAHETAAFEQLDIDVNALSPEELVLYATLARLHRLVDKNYQSISADHLMNMATMQGADRMVDVADADYLMNLNLSYAKISQLAEEMIAAANKFKIQPPQTWLEFRDGQFDFQAELQRGNTE